MTNTTYKTFETSRWKCPSCGGEKDAKAKLCQSCRRELSNSKRPSPDQLRRVLELCGDNYNAAGRFLHVSGKTVRRWATQNGEKKEERT